MDPRERRSVRLGLGVASVVLLALVGGCPGSDPQCPGCTVKSGNYTIPVPDRGYEYDSGKMTANVSYSGTCPLKPPPSPCEHSGSRRITDLKPGEKTEPLPMETGDNGTYDVTVTLVVVAPDGTKVNKTIPVDVNL